MHVTQIVYSKTIQENQYEPEILEATATIEEGEDFEEAAVKLRDQVRSVLGIGKAKAAPVKKEEKKDEEPPEVPSESSEEVEKPRATNSKKAKTTKKTTRRKKPVKYDREVKDHKTKLGELLTEHFPDWKKSDEMKRLAKEASTDLEGEDFIDAASGEIVESFIKKLVKAMESGSGDEL